jgi:hypothetical protein
LYHRNSDRDAVRSAGLADAVRSAGLASKVFVAKETIKSKALDEKVFGPLAASAVILLVASELLYWARRAFGEGGLIVEVLWHLFRVTAALAFLALIVVFVVRGWRVVKGRLAH